MSAKDHLLPGKNPKQDFQVERIAFFSDAVFAIAITLLVIEFRVPYRLFLLNNILAGVMMYYFYWLLMKKYKEMSFPMEKEDNREFERKLIVMTLSFTLVVIISFFSTEKSI